MTTTTSDTMPGTAGAVIAAGGPALEVEPLYGPRGSDLYDRIAESDVSEIGDVLALARTTTGPVLDLACGSGRLTLPLLRRRRHVTGLDDSPRMLELLRRRVEAEAPAVRARADTALASMDRMSFPREFGYIVLGASSVVLLDDEARRECFRLVRRHLAADGVFALSLAEFDGAAWDVERPFEVTSVVAFEARGSEPASTVSMFQHFDRSGGVRTTALLQQPLDGATAPTMYTSRLRLLEPALLVEDLRAAGLDVRGRRTVHEDVMATSAGQLVQRHLLFDCVPGEAPDPDGGRTA